MRLLTAVDKYSNPMFGWIVRIAIETGMRLSEISTLRIHQVEIDRRLVRLDLTKNSSPRTVPLTVEAARVMTEALANPLRPAETDLVFSLESRVRTANADLTYSIRHGRIQNELPTLRIFASMI